MLTSFDASVDRPLGRSAGILFRVEMLSQVLLRSIGVVFLSSVALKIVDPLFHQKASLSFGFLVGLLLVSSFRDRPILIAEIIPGHAIRDGFLDGQVRLWNAGGDPIRLVGAGRTRCEGLVSIDEPILLERGESAQQRCVLPWRTTSLFRSGVFRLNVERGGNAEIVDVPWVVLR